MWTLFKEKEHFSAFFVVGQFYWFSCKGTTTNVTEPHGLF